MFNLSFSIQKKGSFLSMLFLGLLALVAVFAGPASALAATGTVTTNHWKNGAVQGYEVTLSVTDPLLGSATVTSGPGVTDPVDLVNAVAGGSASLTLTVPARPLVSDSYVVSVTKQDSSVTPLTLHPTGVIDAFPGIADVSKGYAATATPSFSWTAPAAAPAAGIAGYRLSVTGSDLQWQPAQLAAAQLSAVFNFDGSASKAVPTTGTLYAWSVAVVDGNGNRAENRAASFMLGPNFSGKVTDMSLAGMPGVLVQALALDANGTPQGASATTQADGSYLYGGLPAGSYRVRFLKPQDVNPAVYYKNELTLAKANSVAVASGSIATGIDAVIGAWGEISGKVVNVAQTAVAGITVNVCNASGQVISSVPAAVTKADGSYTLAPVAPGTTYRIKFSGNSQYAGQWYNAAALPADAIPVSVEAGLTTSLANVVLQTISISGRLTTVSGAGIAGVQVYLYDSNSNPLSFVLSLSDGSYAMSGIAPGSYKVGFLDPTGTYLRQYYNKKTTRQLADLLTVSAGVPLTGISATLGTGVPTVTSFSVPATPKSLTVTGIVMTATEPNGVAGYLLTESATPPLASAAGWSASAPTSYTFASGGAKTLYAWAKGSTGLVSAGVARTLNITLTLTVQMAGSGSGTVNSTPSGIACVTGSSAGCSTSVTGGSFSLIASSSADSTFVGWSGACTGTGSCVTAMTADKTVTATFAVAPLVKIGATSYATLQAAYNAALTGAVIQMKEGVLTGSLIAGSAKAVTVKGGYSADYSVVSSETVLDGQILLRSGSVKMQKVKLK